MKLLKMLEKVAYVAVPILITVGLIRKYLDHVWGHCKGTDSLKGKTYIITGANSGIGLETAKALVKRKARVIFACRNTGSAEKAVAEIRKQNGKVGEMIIMHLDLSSLESIRSFADRIKFAFFKIDALINNAGVYVPMEIGEKTEEGFETHLGVNHLGHFLLTDLLLDLLQAAAPSRVVILSSLLHERGKIDFEDLNLKHLTNAYQSGDKAVIKQYGRMNPGYCNSKLMNVYFGRSLAEKTRTKGIDVFMVCPGFTYTNLFNRSLKLYHFILMMPIFLFYMRSAKQGAQTVLYCATEPSLKGMSGSFYRNCVPYHSKVEFNRDIQEKLWDVSELLVADPKTKQ